MSRIYNDEGKLTGEMIDGQFVPLAQAPEGDQYDDLWDLCSRSFETNPRLKGKLDQWFAANTETGQHSQWLGDEVALWIKEGDLRSHIQVNEVVRSYADHWDRLVRLGVINSWLVDLGTIKQFRWFFGVHGSQPLPSKNEFIAAESAWKKRQEEQERIAAAKRREDKRVLDANEKEISRTDRIASLSKNIAAKLWSYDRIDFAADPLPPEYEDRTRKRRIFRKSNAGLIGLMVDGNLSNEEIEGGMIQNIIDDLKAIGGNEIRPLKEGELRKFFTESEFKHFLTNDYVRHMDEYGESSLMIGLDGLFVATFSPRTPLTEAEEAALATATKKSA